VAAEAEAALQRQEITHPMRVLVLGELSGAIAVRSISPSRQFCPNAQTEPYLLKKDSPLRAS